MPLHLCLALVCSGCVFFTKSNDCVMEQKPTTKDFRKTYKASDLDKYSTTKHNEPRCVQWDNQDRRDNQTMSTQR